MSKFQNVKFSDIEEFLDFLPKEELRIVNHLRAIILDCFPNPVEKLAYNVPYYYQHGRVCFIWPSSIPWGNVKKDGVILGFVNGHLMRDEIGYLEADKRKLVRTKTFFKVSEIDPDLIKTYIFEALAVDSLQNK